MRTRQPLSTSYMQQSCYGRVNPKKKFISNFKWSSQESGQTVREPSKKANACRIVRMTTFRKMLPTTNLDGSDVSSLYFDSPQHARVCKATPKRPQLEDTSISADENALSFTSDNFASSPWTEAPTDTSPIPVRSERTPRPVNYVKGKVPENSKPPKNLRQFETKHKRQLQLLLTKCQMQYTSTVKG